MQMSFDQALAFCSVVDLGGYSKAAVSLNKSHSALIYLVRSLEEQCGFALFDRKGYRNTLTPEGKRVYSKCQEILAQVEELGQLCGQLKQNWEASLKIVFDGILPFDPFLKLYKKFREEKVPTVVQTYTDYLEDVEKTFEHQQADMMIGILPIEKKNIKSVYLKPFKSYLVAHRDHPINKANQKWTSKDLLNFDFLTIRGPSQKLGLQTSEFESSASFFLSDFSVKKQAIMKKTGFGWLPHHLIEAELQSRTLLPIKWERENQQKIQPILFHRVHRKSGSAAELVTQFFKNDP